MIELQRDGDVRILRMDEGENRFSPGFLDQLEKALGELESAEGPRALVTIGTGKFFSNGLDLEWLTANPDRFEPYLDRVHAVFARFLTLPMPTVAALNGHAFAAGAMLALTHDQAVMRSDRGYFCLPEVDLGLSFTPGMAALIQARLPRAIAHEAMLTGRRYAAPDACEASIVQRHVPEAEVLPTAVAMAAPLAAKDGATVGRIRTAMYEPVLAALSSR
ncbi:enoyl-CoA hydratase/isomerase family protein [Actinoallomurus rhizosphaericola]|uniref:enoyl-CoA hydratase/isomerase family protein n=1 Tax=Actinoallomurus rhizosphaericola TaxID=2952536 RepID=UPI00209199F2|nr:enoyl-CoA hydratase/isomerase family protein [Actinoallomurus rhizosphaericola]MCO5992239.1 enoyl-CoA hydratase/isomerase family protein [Actinoallomurus rhizosphaericola]